MIAPANCAAFDRVDALFSTLSTPAAVAVCRAIARGHAAHAATLVMASPARAGRDRRKVEQARDAEQFWAALALRYGVLDLLEEHEESLPSAVASSLFHFAERQGREIFDPIRGGGYAQMKVNAFLPPSEHLPHLVPAALLHVFGSDLGLEVENLKNKSGTDLVSLPVNMPIRKRVRPALPVEQAHVRPA